MKIAIVTSTFPPYRGGMGNVAQHEAYLLAKAGHQVTVITPAYGNIPEVNQKQGAHAEKEYSVQYVQPVFAIGNAAMIPGVIKYVNGFDAVHLHYPCFGGAEWVAIKTLWDKRFSFTMTYHMDVVGSGWKSYIFKLYSRFVFPFIARRAKRIIVSSLDYAQTSPILKRVWKHVEPKLVEIPFPVLHEPADQQVSASQLAAQRQMPNANKYFICIGGLDSAHYFKGIPNVLRAFALAKPRLRGFALKIIGDGNSKVEYQDLARQLNIADDVHFVGSLPQGSEYAQMLRGARALVCASIDRSEAFGLVLLDALAVNVPLIASNLPGVRTVATPNVALRIAPNEVTALAVALVTLANNDKLHAELVAAIPEKRKEYSTDKYLRATLDALAI